MRHKLYIFAFLLLGITSCSKKHVKQSSDPSTREMTTYTDIAEKHLESPIVYKESPEGTYMLCQNLDKTGKVPMGTKDQQLGTLRTHFVVIGLEKQDVVWEGNMAAKLSWESDHRVQVEEVTATSSAPTAYLYDLRTKKKVAIDSPRE